MENRCKEVLPHPLFLDGLFAFKNKVSTVFKDVLGLYEIHHLALTRINKHKQLITLSSTPAMEYNLFSGQLWRYDQTYNPHWYQLHTQDYWQQLYQHTRYDELYYLKQIKHNYPTGISMAAKINEETVIYSLASHSCCPETQELFAHKQEDFYKIGQYCLTLLDAIFNHCDSFTSHTKPTGIEYETSK